jgi:tetratricopeptide (TPR) repeat protein
LSGLNSYIKDIKDKVNQELFSPLFIRLANLYYHDGQYDKCINICNIGLIIYPDYITTKILLLKSLLKLEYITEAENILRELEDKFPDMVIIRNYRAELNQLKKSNKQEKIYYPNKINVNLDFHNYSKKLNDLIEKDILTNVNLEDLIEKLASNNLSGIFEVGSFERFSGDFNMLRLEPVKQQKEKPEEIENNRKNLTGETQGFFSKIKIITETLADILAKQGFFKEAFEAYNLLLQSDTANKRRIQEKLFELERHY